MLIGGFETIVYFHGEGSVDPFYGLCFPTGLNLGVGGNSLCGGTDPFGNDGEYVLWGIGLWRGLQLWQHVREMALVIMLSMFP